MQDQILPKEKKKKKKKEKNKEGISCDLTHNMWNLHARSMHDVRKMSNKTVS